MNDHALLQENTCQHTMPTVQSRKPPGQHTVLEEASMPAQYAAGNPRPALFQHKFLQETYASTQCCRKSPCQHKLLQATPCQHTLLQATPCQHKLLLETPMPAHSAKNTPCQHRVLQDNPMTTQHSAGNPMPAHRVTALHAGKLMPAQTASWATVQAGLYGPDHHLKTCCDWQSPGVHKYSSPHEMMP